MKDFAKPYPKPWKALTIFVLFLLTSASLLAMAPRSFGPVQVGSGKVLVDYGANDVEDGEDPRLAQHLPAQVLDKEAKRFLDVIRGVGDIAQGMKMPDQLLLKIGAIESNPSANSFFNVINLGTRFGIVDGNKRLYTQHPDEMVPVTAHEFGHIIFFENVLMEISFFKTAAAQFRDLRFTYRTVSDLREQELSLGGHPRGARERARVQQERLEWEAEMADLMGKLQIPRVISHVIKPYNEFFADVVAVLYTEKPDAISDSVHFTMPARPRQRNKAYIMSVHNRAFEREGVAPRALQIPHGVFARTRWAIWEEFLSRPTVMRNHKAEVLQGVARAIRSELNWFLSLPGMPRDQLSAEDARQMNLRLIQSLRKELGKL
ncbi:MAG: hypothetical protein NDI61_12120 [Bdellovibrionaceae bacterium]|nr:hypothetical protein [Pseudobdellovibrionaceae bacterium]